MLSRGGSVLAPPGVVMVAPQTALRNAEGAMRRPRWWRMAQYNAANNRGIIKAGTPEGPGPKPTLCPLR
jgi:hypothetical protein